MQEIKKMWNERICKNICKVFAVVSDVFPNIFFLTIKYFLYNQIFFSDLYPFQTFLVSKHTYLIFIHVKKSK